MNDCLGSSSHLFLYRPASSKSWINIMINASIIHREVHLSEQKQKRSFDWFQMKRALNNSENLTIAATFLGALGFPLKKDLNDLSKCTQSIHTSIIYLKHSDFKCGGTFHIQLNIFYGNMKKRPSVRENKKTKQMRMWRKWEEEKDQGKVINFLLKGWLLVWFNSSESGWYLKGKLQSAKAWPQHRMALSHTHACTHAQRSTSRCIYRPQPVVSTNLYHWIQILSPALDYQDNSLHTIEYRTVCWEKNSKYSTDQIIKT